jgi:hypothetical protein
MRTPQATKIARRQHIKQMLRWLRESDNLFLDDSITHSKDQRTAIAKGNTNNAKRVAINYAQAQCDQPTICLPDAAVVWPSTAWAPCSIGL